MLKWKKNALFWYIYLFDSQTQKSGKFQKKYIGDGKVHICLASLLIENNSVENTKYYLGFSYFVCTTFSVLFYLVRMSACSAITHTVL